MKDKIIMILDTIQNGCLITIAICVVLLIILGLYYLFFKYKNKLFVLKTIVKIFGAFVGISMFFYVLGNLAWW